MRATLRAFIRRITRQKRSATMAATTKTKKKQIRILCFGDSLTAGYSKHGYEFQPYHKKMVARLQMELPELEIVVEEDGVSGDLTKNFEGRMLKHFGPDKEEPFDWTIVLGGTNDIAYNYSAVEIFGNLEKTWNIPLSKGGNVLALTVPELGTTLFAELGILRADLNGLIKEEAGTHQNLHVFDFHKEMPYASLSPQDQKRYWDDSVHLTSDGYDLMGHKIAGHLVPILRREGEEEKKAGAAAPATAVATETIAPRRPGARVRPFRNDETAFDEEAGDPARLEQGYIVVRRVDLS